MTRYFFDRIGQGRSEYDYQGCFFASPDKAKQLAELMAIDLEIEPDGKWCGWSIDVRDPKGEKFFSIPVRASELAAA
jgi:hypothetical protein